MNANKQIEDAFHKFSSAVDALRQTVVAMQVAQEHRDVSQYIRETIQNQQQTVGREPRAADVINSSITVGSITYEPYEIFRHEDGRMYQCLLRDSERCNTCSFRFKLCFALNCTAEGRDDGLPVRFVPAQVPRVGMLYRTAAGEKCMLVHVPFNRPCLCNEHKGRCHGLNTLLFAGIRCKLMFDLRSWHWVPLN